jgi:hypothetical protein
VEYRVVREWYGGVVDHYNVTSADQGKRSLADDVKAYDPDLLKAGWIETRTVTSWTKL